MSGFKGAIYCVVVNAGNLAQLRLCIWLVDALEVHLECSNEMEDSLDISLHGRYCLIEVLMASCAECAVVVVSHDGEVWVLSKTKRD